MKIRFPVLIKNKRQLNSLFEYLDSKDLKWATGESLLDDNTFRLIAFPLWIFYDPNKYNNSISFANANTEERLEEDYISKICYYTPTEIDFDS